MDESYVSWLRLIPGVSADLAKRIAERYPDPALLKGATAKDLGNVHGMTGEVGARVLELVRAASTADASWYREEPALYLCPECGSFVGKGANACPFCGVVFDEGESAAPASPVEELLQSRNGEAKICTRCGAFLEPGATACGVCGSEYTPERVAGLPAVDTTPLPDPDLFLCPHCGAFLSHAAAACAICGSPVDADARIPGLAREGRGVSKDFLSRWQRVTSEVAIPAAAAPEARSLEDELAEYERILDADPSLPRAWVHKGRILARLERTADSIVCLDRAARIDPENEDLYRLEALGLLGSAADLSVLPPRWKVAAPGAPADNHDLDLDDAPRGTPVPATEVPTQVVPATARVSVRTVEREAPKKVAPATKPVTPPPVQQEAAAIRRALAYYDRLLAMDSGLRVAWQTKGELLLRLGRTADADLAFQRAADIEVAEREFGRSALTGLQTRGPTLPAPPLGTPSGGRTNGRVNGLTNGRRGRTNGRVNGLTNGSGATNGLTNGLGRVNGLMSGLARGEGRTNGLVNGNGFTNGRRGRPTGPLPSAGREWARSLVGIAAVVLLMVLAPILASLFTSTPAATGIAIDGAFGDWNAVSVLYSDPVGDTRGNPDVDLVGYKVAAGPDGLSVYTRVQGLAFQGLGNATDLLVALIDSDHDPATGYDVGRLGANYMVELVGWDSAIREAPLYEWRGTNRTDWFGFQSAGSAAAASSGSETEFSIGISSPESARVLLATVDGLGRTDVADAVVVPGKPALAVREVGIAPGVIASTTRVPVLQLNLTPAGLPVAITSLNLTKRGSLADAAISLTLFRDDGDGVFTTSDVSLGTASVAQGRASFPIALTLAQPATVFVTADLTVLPANETFGVDLRDIGTNGIVSVASANVSLSYLASAPAPTVDGAFADWAGIPRSVDPAGDVANRTGVSTVMNANVDLTEVGSFLSQNATFYLRVDGTMLGGVDVPNLRTRTPPPSPVDSDRDGVPDIVDPLLYDFNNDGTPDSQSGGDVDQDTVTDWPNGPDYWLNTTIPASFPAPYANRTVSVYIGPIAPRTLEGVDSAIVYLDGDNRSTTGLPVAFGFTTYGLDWAVVVVGRHGAVTASELYRYRPASLIPWTFVASVPAAVDGTHLEIAVPDALLNLSAGYRTAYYATDWQLSYDVALPVPPGRSAGAGTRSALGNNVVINEISPRPNPEWIELANPTSALIVLSGWTVQMQQGNGGGGGGGKAWTTIYVFPAGSSIGAWGSGSEYPSVNLANDLPNGGASVRLRDAAGTVVDLTSYPNVANGRTWARFKDPTTGKPMDSDNDAADFYTSLVPSKSGPNDRHRPSIVVAKTANRATAAPGDQITYTVYYNNTNTGRANHVWINDTLPAQVTFVSSSVPPGNVSGRVYGWHFMNVGPNSLNSLTVTVRVNDGTGSGVVLVNRADLAYKDQLNRSMGTSSAWRNVTTSRPVITVAKIADKKTALPGDRIVYTIYYNNTGSASAQHVWINDTLPSGVTYVSSSVPPTSVSGQEYRWHFTNVGVGAHSFTITVQVNANPGTSLLVNWVFLNYTTQSGYKLEESRASWTTSIPEFSDLAIVAVVPIVFLGVRRLRRGKAGKAE